MDSQQYNRRLHLLQRPGARDAWGAVIPDAPWVEMRKAWANIRTANGAAAIKADASSSTVKASIRLRYCTDVQAGMRVRHGTVLYDVEAVLPDMEGRQHVDLVCTVVP